MQKENKTTAEVEAEMKNFVRIFNTVSNGLVGLAIGCFAISYSKAPPAGYVTSPEFIESVSAQREKFTQRCAQIQTGPDMYYKSAADCVEKQSEHYVTHGYNALSNAWWYAALGLCLVAGGIRARHAVADWAWRNHKGPQ